MDISFVCGLFHYLQNNEYLNAFKSKFIALVSVEKHYMVA